MKKRRHLFLFLVMLVTLLFSCTVTVFGAVPKITLKSGARAPSTVYAGRTYTLKVSGISVKFYSGDKKIATVGLTTGKMKPVAPGKVKITAKNKKTGRAVATATFTVLKRATSIQVTPGEVILKKGGEKTLKSTLDPENSTDVVRFYSTDKTVVTVGAISGKVKYVGDGEAKIKVYAKATKATSSKDKTNKIAVVDVECGVLMKGAEQSSYMEVQATLNMSPEINEIGMNDFILERSSTQEKILIDGMRINDKQVMLELTQGLEKNETYALTLGKKTVEFKSTGEDNPWECKWSTSQYSGNTSLYKYWGGMRAYFTCDRISDQTEPVNYSDFRVESSDESIVQLQENAMTENHSVGILGVHSGSAGFIVYYQNERIAVLPVTVVTYVPAPVEPRHAQIVSVTQRKLNEILVEFDRERNDVLQEDNSLEISEVDTGEILPAEFIEDEAVLSDLPYGILLQTVSDLKFNTKYQVRYGKSTMEFTTSDGVVRSLEVTPTEIPVNTPTLIQAIARDGKGMLLWQEAQHAKLDFYYLSPEGWYTSPSSEVSFENENESKIVVVRLQTDTEGGYISSQETTICASPAN